jgi:nucleoside-diphosphate-sugar epimerase
MKTNRIVITGATGFLGRHVMTLLNAYDCIFLKGSQRNQNALADESTKFYSVEELIAGFSEIDVVVHLAAFIPYGKLNEPSSEFEAVNVALTERLTQAYPKARWIFASSVSVYGNKQTGIITSETIAQPDTLYGASKLRAEQIVTQLENAVIIRFSSILGKGMKPVSVVPKWIEQAKQENRITVWGEGTRKQNYLDVRDAAMLVYLLVRNEWKGKLLGVAHREYSNSQVAGILAEEFGAEIIHTPHSDEPGVGYDDYAAHEQIGFIPKFELRETIQHMIEV